MSVYIHGQDYIKLRAWLPAILKQTRCAGRLPQVRKNLQSPQETSPLGLRTLRTWKAQVSYRHLQQTRIRIIFRTRRAHGRCPTQRPDLVRLSERHSRLKTLSVALEAEHVLSSGTNANHPMPILGDDSIATTRKRTSSAVPVTPSAIIKRLRLTDKDLERLVRSCNGVAMGRGYWGWIRPKPTRNGLTSLGKSPHSKGHTRPSTTG